jgi:hypothetical protein
MLGEPHANADPLLPLLLGLAAIVIQLGVWIEGEAPPDATGDVERPLELLLGAVSMRHALLAALIEAAATPYPTGSAPRL